MRALCLSLTLLTAAAAHAELQQIVALAAPDGRYRAYHDWTYAHAVRVGDQVWVSGVPGRGETDAEQFRSALEGVRRALQAAGAELEDVVELRSYHTDLDAARFAALTAVRRELFPTGFTAWTAVGTSALLAPGARIEVAATAVVGSGKLRRGVPPAP